MRKRPRQTDVARLAGVSPATVSLVVNNRIGGNVRISEETRQRVLDAVEKVGYIADPAARSLAGGRNRLLGVFTYEAIFPLQHRDFYYPFLLGIEQEAECLEYDLLLLTSSGGNGSVRRIYRQGKNRLRMADGSILLGTAEGKEEIVRLYHEGYPFVFVGRREIPGGEISYAAADYVQATAQVIEHVLRMGHRRIAYLAHVGDTEAWLDRRSGFRLALRHHGLPVEAGLVRHVEIEELTPSLFRSLLSEQVTATILEDHVFLPPLLAAAQAVGKRPPHDYSLALLDDPVSDVREPMDLTTFDIPRREMGAHAVRLLAHILDHPDDPGPHRITLPCTFVPGNTASEPVPLSAS